MEEASSSKEETSQKTFYPKTSMTLNYIGKLWNRFLSVHLLDSSHEEDPVLKSRLEQKVLLEKQLSTISLVDMIHTTERIPDPDDDASHQSGENAAGSTAKVSASIAEDSSLPNISVDWLIERELLKQQENIPPERYLWGQISLCVNPRRAAKWILYITVMSLLNIWCIVVGIYNLYQPHHCSVLVGKLSYWLISFGSAGLVSLCFLVYILLYLEVNHEPTWVDHLHKILQLLLGVLFLVGSSVVLYAKGTHSCGNEFIFLSVYWVCIGFYSVFGVFVFFFIITFLRVHMRTLVSRSSKSSPPNRFHPSSMGPAPSYSSQDEKQTLDDPHAPSA